MPTHRSAPQVQGFVLVGGRSTRFGSDKALALLRGRPLLDWALSALNDLGVSGTVVGPDADPYRAWCSSFITWERPGLGPAEGVRAALESSNTLWSLVLSVDMPWVTAGVLAVLTNAIPSDQDFRAVVFADADGRRHPFPGVYHQSLAVDIAQMREGASLQEVLDAACCRSLRQIDLASGTDLGAILRNANRPEDLEQEWGPDPL